MESHWYEPSTYARCRVNKTRWFWVVFDSWLDELEMRSTRYGYERSAVESEAAARRQAGPRARRSPAWLADYFVKGLRAGRVNRPSRWRPDWCIKLGLTMPCRVDDVKTAYRRLAKSAHPDVGGRAEDFVAIESAYREAMEYCRRSGTPLAS
jgi:hypothetical protein